MSTEDEKAWLNLVNRVRDADKQLETIQLAVNAIQADLRVIVQEADRLRTSLEVQA